MEKPPKQNKTKQGGASIIRSRNAVKLFPSLYKPWLPAIDSVVVNKYTFAANGRSAKRLGWLRLGGRTGVSEWNWSILRGHFGGSVCLRNRMDGAFGENE